MNQTQTFIINNKIYIKHPYLLTVIVTFLCTVLMIAGYRLITAPQYRIVAQREVRHNDGTYCKEFAVTYKHTPSYTLSDIADQLTKDQLQTDDLDSYDTLHYYFYTNPEAAKNFDVPDCKIQAYMSGWNVQP